VKADLRKIQHVPGPWEKCRKLTWASRMKQRLLKENQSRRQKKRWNKPEVNKEHKVPVPIIVKPKVKESNKQIKKVNKRSSKHSQPDMEQKDEENRIQKKTHSNGLYKLESVGSKEERKDEEEKLSMRSSTSRKRRKNLQTGAVKRNRCEELKTSENKQAQIEEIIKKGSADKDNGSKWGRYKMKGTSLPNELTKKISSNVCTPQSSTSATKSLTSFFHIKNNPRNKKANPRKLTRYNVKWWQNSSTNGTHTDFHYGVSLISKDTKQVIGEVTFDRNAKAVWELELASDAASLEITFGEDFLVLRVNVEDTTKRSFEIRFMHWSKMVRTTLISGDEEHEDSFSVNLKTLRFKKKKNVAAVVLMQKLNTAFVWDTLKDLHPVQSAHRAVFCKYKRFSETLKTFLPEPKVIKKIWCFAISPAVMGARTMCELRKGVIAAFDESGFNIVTLGPVLTIFRKRALEDLVMGNDFAPWVSKACSKIECFEKILKNEACMLE